MSEIWNVTQPTLCGLDGLGARAEYSIKPHVYAAITSDNQR
jgi:hypothetical protein